LNYFPFHLGDYAAHTGHLEPMEDLAYRRLLDQYYMREGPLPADIQVTAKLVRMRSMAADVESVLHEFFVLTDAGWTHSRCEAEILHMQDKQTKARASAQASVKARQASAEARESARLADAAKKQADVELPTPTPTPTPTPIRNTEDCADLLPESVQPATEFSIPLNDGTEYQVPAKDLAEWERAYLAVDVPQELRQMRTWILANPTKRKTRRGVAAFIVRWLSKAQDTPRANRTFAPAAGSEVFV
jgi:uncharacterized protein YdaU (DUF1376 family)